ACGITSIAADFDEVPAGVGKRRIVGAVSRQGFLRQKPGEYGQRAEKQPHEFPSLWQRDADRYPLWLDGLQRARLRHHLPERRFARRSPGGNRETQRVARMKRSGIRDGSRNGALSALASSRNGSRGDHLSPIGS